MKQDNTTSLIVSILGWFFIIVGLITLAGGYSANVLDETLAIRLPRSDGFGVIMYVVFGFLVSFIGLLMLVISKVFLRHK